jgi:NADPH:quinone reductase-like Zn-dependent oxidoreductase
VQHDQTDLVTSIGADHVIDYSQDDFADGPQRYDLILDIGGNSSLTWLRRALTPRGTLVIVGGKDSGRWKGLSRQLRTLALSPFVRQRLTIRIPKETHADTQVLAELSAAGQLTPVIDKTFPLADAADAMRYLEAGQARGNLASGPPLPDGGVSLAEQRRTRLRDGSERPLAILALLIQVVWWVDLQAVS